MALAIGNCSFGLMLTYMYQGEPARAAQAAARARASYEEISWDWMANNVIRMECLRALAYAADRPEEWRRLAAEWDARSIGDVPAREVQALRPGLAMVLAAEGRWDEARSLTASMLDDLRPLHRQGAILLVAGLDRACGKTEAAWEMMRAMLPDGPMAQSVHQYRMQEPALQLGAALALDEGDLPTAASWLAAHDALLARSGAILGRSENQALWARYHRIAGDTEGACAHAERALQHASAPRQPLALLAAHRLHGELDTDAGQYERAAQHLDASLVLADACQLPYERTLTLLAMAELRAATGDISAARTLLNEVRAICATLGAKPTLARIDALSARLITMAGVAPAAPDGLSAREIEVLRLLANGMSNQGIADTLSISVRTVERHITNLYGKIGAGGRADATAYVHSHLA
ncbi:MAG: LuxR C-terminal-related transcriptional regulator [Thermomicrobiales bacterium]